MKMRAHARAHDFRVEWIGSPRREQHALDARGPRGTQNGAKVSGITHLIQNESEARGGGGSEFGKRVNGGKSLWGFSLGKSAHDRRAHLQDGVARSLPGDDEGAQTCV